jgi:hypothetical protein
MDPGEATLNDDQLGETRAPERDAPTNWVACPSCEGTGQPLPVDGRPCGMCARSGLVTADVAKEIAASEEMEVEPKGDGEPPQPLMAILPRGQGG